MNRAPLLLLAFVLSGCAVTDTGNPPLAPIDTDQMSAAFLAGGTVTLSGAPATVEGALGLMRITNLATMDAPVDATVRPDGSFDAMLFAEAGAVLRVQHVVGDERSPPVDVSADTARPATAIAPCLMLDPDLELNAGPIGEPTEVVLRLDNMCASPVSFSVRSRRDAPGLLVTAGPTDDPIPPTGSMELRLDVLPPSTGEAEEILFLELTTPAQGLRAVTVRASAP